MAAAFIAKGLNAPTGAWCSLTQLLSFTQERAFESQCTYRCVVLPDETLTYCKDRVNMGLNAPTGAWCSLTSWCA